MKRYLHRVLGLYATRNAAESVRDQLVQGGLPLEKMTILEHGRTGRSRETVADSDDVLYEMIREGTIGGVIGMLVGFAGTLALVFAKASLFASAPLLGTAIMLGWGASIGVLVGALAGARNGKGEVADMIAMALASGHVVLVAHAVTEKQTARARRIIDESMGSASVAASVAAQ